jgi:hypothetical protein
MALQSKGFSQPHYFQSSGLNLSSLSAGSANDTGNTAGSLESSPKFTGNLPAINQSLLLIAAYTLGENMPS